MHAILLAAGRGKRLAEALDSPQPKCLLEFGGDSLLERHLHLLQGADVNRLTIMTGFEAGQIHAAVAAFAPSMAVDFLHNPAFTRGSLLSVHCAREHLAHAREDVLLMDADVLYDQRILGPLCAGASVDRVLFDTAFTPGDEPVKLCLNGNRIVEFCKKVGDGVDFDVVGETVGFFRLQPQTAARLAKIVSTRAGNGGGDDAHEEALRDLFFARPEGFDVIDIAPAPWLEIDFPEDLQRAREAILPKLKALL